MSRALVLAMVIATLPPACAKMLGKKAPVAEDPAATADSPPPPPPTVTTPPIWQNPNVTPTASSTATIPVVDPQTVDLTKAQAAFDAKDFKKAKSILEKRVKGGKCITDEVTLLTKTCQQLKDKTCVADAKKACPPSQNTSNDPPAKTGF